MLKIQPLQTFCSIVGLFNERARTVVDFFEHPFGVLTRELYELRIVPLVSAPSVEWEYIVDSASGLKILKSEKDPEALTLVKELADEMFK